MSIPSNENNTQTTTTPPKQSPSGAEMFVGLNILSKIGVVFIIIGVIAFAVVSEDYIPPIGRTLMVFGLGVIMAVLGELFYRKNSKIFARAMTLGAVFDWSVAVLVGYYTFGALNDLAAALIGAAAAAGGLFLAWRYSSQTIMITAVVCSALPFYAAADGKVGIFAIMAATVCVHVAALIISNIKGWKAVCWVGMTCALVLSVSSRIALSDIFREWEELALSIVAVAFMFLLFAVYIVSFVYDGAKKSGALTSAELARLIIPNAAFIITAMLMMCFDKTACGIMVAVFTVIYLAAAVGLRLKLEKCSLASVFECTVLALIPIALFLMFTLRWVIIAINLYGAVLVGIGLFRNNRLYKICGYVALVLAEFGFLFGAIPNMKLPIFTLQFALNAAVFLAIMVCYAVKKRTGAGLSVYSAAAIFNAALFFIYLICEKLMPAIAKAGSLTTSERDMFEALFCSVLWFAAAFVTGKLKFMGKGAAITSIGIYGIGLICLLAANIETADISHEGVLTAVAIILVNLISVAAVLDIVKRAETLANKTMQSIALVVSMYALFTLTVTLSTNGWVAFTSCIISIIYILVAVFWITLGFARNKPLTRRFGLALTLLASAKLFLFDFSEINAMGRTLMFIGFGITLLAISFVYGYFEMKAKKQ